MLHGDIEREEVDGEAQEDEQEHVGGQEGELPGLGQVVLRVLEGAAHHPGGIGEGDIEIGALGAIHGCGSHPRGLLGAATRGSRWTAGSDPRPQALIK